MKLATATLSAAALLAFAGPALAEATGATTFWERQRSGPTKESAPYALTGDARRTSGEDFKACTRWVGANRERRTVYERR